MSMTHRERVSAAVHGEPVDRLPVALWRHFPGADATADGLASAVIAFQQAFDFDLVKVTPASGYPAEAWGARLVPESNLEGTRRYNQRVIDSPEDWRALPVLEPTHGAFGRELAALRAVRAGVGEDVPVLQTVFNPLTIAKQLVGPTVLEHMQDHATALMDGLATIAETSVGFAQACLSNGADGIFFATQFARHDLMSEEAYRDFGTAYDRVVLDAVRDRAGLVVLHLCGEHVMFELADLYGADIVNWHDRTTPPTLGEGLARRASGAVLGGLDRGAELRLGSPADVAAAVSRAAADTGGRRTMIGTGCVTLVDTPSDNLRAARAAVDTLRGAVPG